MIITQVEQQKKNPRRFNIFLDGKFAFGADEDLVVERRLVVGKEILSEDLEKILFEAEVGKLMERMYRWFGIRQHSEKEVRDKFKIQNLKFKILGKEQISDLVINSLIEKLKQKGLLNDQIFARAWVEARRKSKNKGKIAIKAELYQKGIDRETIEEVISEQSLVGNEEQLAKQALEKRLKRFKSLPYLEQKKKSYEFLMRQGFEYSVVKDVVEKLVKKS